MDNQQLAQDYTKNILTLSHARYCTEKLREMHEALYEKNIDVKSKLDEILPYFLTEAILLHMQDKKIQMSEIDQIQDALNSIKKSIEDIPVVELVLPFTPNNRQLKKLSDWWDEYSGKHLLLSVEFDDTLLIGAKISYNGIYADYSLSHFLESPRAQ